VSASVVVAGAEHPKVGAERQREAHDDREHRRRRQPQRDVVELDVVVEQQQAERDHRGAGRQREHGAAAEDAGVEAPLGLPRGEGDEHVHRRPAGVEDPVLDVGVARHLVEVDRVDHGEQAEAEGDEHPRAARPPPGDGDDADDERQQREVAERVAEVVATAASEPSVLATTPKTSAAPSAATARDEIRPSSHKLDGIRPARARSSRTSATYEPG